MRPLSALGSHGVPVVSFARPASEPQNGSET